MKKRKKVFAKLIRNIEAIKTVIIILLMVSCVYFGFLILQYQTISDAENVSFFVWNNFEYMFDGYNESENETVTDSRKIFSEAASPIYAVVNKSEKERKILKRDEEEYKTVCDIASRYILSLYTGESRTEAAAVTGEEWTEDLKSGFVYLKFPIEIDNSMIEGTAYEGNVISKIIKSYDEVILVVGENNEKYKGSAVIYLGSSRSSERVRLILDRSPLPIIELINSQTYGAEKECIFAYELKDEKFSDYSVIKGIKRLNGDGLLNVNPMFAFPMSTIKTPSISLSVPNGYSEEFSSSEKSDIMNEILNLLGSDMDGARQYKDNDGNVAFVDGESEITFSMDGEISYTNSRVISEGSEISEKKLIVSSVSDLYNKILRILDIISKEDNSDESIFISDISSYRDSLNESVIISDVAFDYIVEGTPVCSYETDSENNSKENHFITARFYNGYLGSLKIKVKDIEVFNEYSPNESAFAAIERYIKEMPADRKTRIYDMNLKYRYNPSSSKVHTTWVLNGEAAQ